MKLTFANLRRCMWRLALKADSDCYFTTLAFQSLIHYLYRVIIPLLVASSPLFPVFFHSSMYSQREGFEANRGKKTMLLDCEQIIIPLQQTHLELGLQ